MPDYKKYFIISAPPAEVYMALTYPPSICLWAGENAIMGTEPNSSFSLFDDSISGINLELEPNKKLVQQWDFGDIEPLSIVTMKLHEHKQGCSLEVRHTNIPEEAWEDISTGWEDTYMASLLDFFN
ncbi:MAG: hypothetical protein RIT07_1103 [Bacteroidota bacterium]